MYKPLIGSNPRMPLDSDIRKAIRVNYKVSLFFVLFCIIFIFFNSCLSLDPARFQSPYYKEDGYINPYPDKELREGGFGRVIRWRLFGPKDPPSVEGLTADPPPVKSIQPEDLHAAEGKIRITLIGHSTVWISIRKNGRLVSMITDPVFKSPPIISRLTAMPLPEKDLPPVDVILVSHAHWDHCDTYSLALLHEKNENVYTIMPDGMGRFAEDMGYKKPVILQWWQNIELHNLKITFTPAQHWSMRLPFSRFQYHWGEFVVEAYGKKVFFAGDTAYSPHFKDITNRFPEGMDAVIMPVGAFRPRWFMKNAHIDPEDALKAHQDLKGKNMFPVHWGTFRLGEDLPTESVELLKKVNKSENVHYWTPGVSVEVDL